MTAAGSPDNSGRNPEITASDVQRKIEKLPSAKMGAALLKQENASYRNVVSLEKVCPHEREAHVGRRFEGAALEKGEAALGGCESPRMPQSRPSDVSCMFRLALLYSLAG